MNGKSFVALLREYAGASAAKIVEEDVRAPTGRKPPETMVQESRWFSSLGPDDQAMVMRIVRRAVDATLFEVFAVLDKVKAIPEPFRHGEFVIKFADQNGEHLVSRPSEDLLHEHYRELCPFE